MGRPSFQFYPDDWMNDLGLRSCSPMTRAIWVDMLCIMHQGEPYGHLANCSGQLPLQFVAGRCGVTLEILSQAVAELEANRVFSRTDEGTVYSRRMVRDEKTRIARASGGIRALMSDAVPRPKSISANSSEGILQGNQEGTQEGYVNGTYGFHPPKDILDSVYIEEEVKKNLLTNTEPASKPSWEEIQIAWRWYSAEYPSEVNEFTDLRLFISLMRTRAELNALQANLPLWKQTQKWRDGYVPKSANFLSRREFMMTPKVREPTAQEPASVTTRLAAKLREEEKKRGTHNH